MKLPGDSDKQDKGVSHEMMQRSLQSQRRVVKRVGMLEDRVEAIDLKLATPTETPIAPTEEPPKPTPIEPEEDWEGEIEDNRKNPFVDKGIDIIRDEIDRDPNIPFSDDKIPYEDDITQIMKDRDESIEKDKEEGVERGFVSEESIEEEKAKAIQPEVLLDGDPRGQDAKQLPTADGKSQRRKTKGKGKIGLPKLLPAAGGVAGGAMVGGLKQIAKNISEARQALFDFYKIQKDRFKLRKKLDKTMQTKMDAQKDEAALEGDPKGSDEDVKRDPKTGVPQKKQSSLEKGLMKAFWGSIATMFFPLLIKGLGTFFNDQADEIENTEPEDPGTEEEEKLANDLEDDTKKLNQEEKQAKQGEEGEERTEAQNEEQTQVTDVQSSQTQDTNLESNISMMQSNVSNQEQSEQEEVQGFAEGGKVTTTSAATNKPKPRGGADGVKPPTPNTNKRQSLQQLRKSDLSGKGAKALSKFVAPIKSVFKLPNIIAKNTLKLGKKILSPVGKLAGTAISKHPLAMMGKGIMNMVKGDKGDKGDGGDKLIEKGVNDDYWHEEGTVTGLLPNFKHSNNYSNIKTDKLTETVEGAPQTPVVEQSKTNKLTEIASSFGSNIMSDIKERGVTGIVGGIADKFTGNLFDFDGKNLKPDQMKNAQIDKGESVTSKMIAALDGARSVQKQQVISKQNSGTGSKMKIPARPTSKSSPSSINKSLQPGL